MSKPRFIAVPLTGGTLNITNVETGVVRVEIGLQAGLHPFSQFLPFISKGEWPQLTDATFVKKSASPIVVNRKEGGFQTAANPDFQPQTATQHEAEMQRQINALQTRLDNKDRLAARDARLAQEQAVRDAEAAQAEAERQAAADAAEAARLAALPPSDE